MLAPPTTAPIHARWLGRIDYRAALAEQHRLVDARASDGIGDQFLLLEHPAVLTLGRNSDPAHILASDAELAARGIGVERVERGGEVTYHGPGQLVAYPIVRLHDRGLLVRPFVRALEAALDRDLCRARRVRGAARWPPGCWCDPDGPEPRKIGALGVRVERGVSYHGIALNIDVDLADFALIDACGMPGVVSTSIARERGELDRRPSTTAVEARRLDRSPRPSPRPSTRHSGARPDRPMASGLFELRKDPITGWWVATVVDRQFHRDRFARAADPVDDRVWGCANCTTPEGDGVRTRMLKDFAFHVVGTDEDARELDRDHGIAQVAARPGARDRQRGGPSWRRRTSIVRCTRSGPTSSRDWSRVRVMPSARLPRPVRPSTSPSSRTGVSRPAPGPTTCAWTCTTCPRSRTGSPRSSAARPASSSARGSARSAGSSATRSAGPTDWSGRTTTASPSRRTPHGPPSRSGSCRAATTPTSPAPTMRPSGRPPRRCARSWVGWRPPSMGRPTTSSCTPPRCASRSTAPITGTGRSTRVCAISPAWSWEPDYRSTPSRRRMRSRNCWAGPAGGGGGSG